jgi:tetratricopeptide (TPR) repeat protein/tRNA A-37 threonylcarbamoyl transferase component Bud32
VDATASVVHPNAVQLALFAAGRLRESEMERLGEHLADCEVCLAVLEQLPEDSIVGLLQDHRSLIDGPFDKAGAGMTGEEVWVTREGPEDPGVTMPSRPVEVENDEVRRPPRAPFEHPRYREKALLGPGGMGLIFLAEDVLKSRPVVLKFLREDLLDRPDLVKRFRFEIAAATRLKHPNIVEAYGAEVFGRRPALVMEYIEGRDLAWLVEQRGPLPVRVGCEFLRQAALGLQCSSRRGMVHRDIKPSNLMLKSDGTLKILDFGLARMRSELTIDPGLTSTGAFLGSVECMAPEQAADPRRADVRADIYSLGCTFYHLLSGSPPFQGTILEVLEAHQKRVATPLNELRPEIPPGLAALVERMMAKEPAQRFQTPRELARALEPFLERKPWPRSGRTLATAMGLVMVLLVGVGVHRLFFLKTRLVLETDLPNGEVYVSQAGKRVATVATGEARSIELLPGRYDLSLMGDPGLRLSRETLTLRKGDRIPISVRRVPVEADPAMASYLKLIQRLRIPVDGRYDKQGGFPPSFIQSFRNQIRFLFTQFVWEWRLPPGSSDTLKLIRDDAPEFKSADMRYNLCVLLARHGWPKLAEEALGLALEAQPRDADALFNLGVLALMDRRPDDAIARFREELQARFYDYGEIHMAIGLALEKQGEKDKALSEVRLATDGRADVANNWYNLGALLKVRGLASEAGDALKRALLIDPDFTEAHDLLGQVLDGMGRTAEAEVSRRRAIELQEMAVAQNNRGIELAEDQKVDQAINAFRKALRRQPRLAEARSNLGAALMGREELAAATALLAEAIRMRPGLAAAHVNLGIALRRQGADEVAASAAFLEALRIQPDIDPSRRCWARVHAPMREEPSPRLPALRGTRPHRPDPAG